MECFFIVARGPWPALCVMKSRKERERKSKNKREREERGNKF